jgi:hypothetical protein
VKFMFTPACALMTCFLSIALCSEGHQANLFGLHCYNIISAFPGPKSTYMSFFPSHIHNTKKLEHTITNVLHSDSRGHILF